MARRSFSEGPARVAAPADGGYNLVILIMILTVMNVMIAVALPLWSQAVKREKEEELIFRGLQYAEAIRVFQRRHGRAPVKLEELMEVKPRSIRKLWDDPMSESGVWGLMMQGVQQPGQRGGNARGGGQRGRAAQRQTLQERQRRSREQQQGAAQGQDRGQERGRTFTQQEWEQRGINLGGPARLVAVPPAKEGDRRGRSSSPSGGQILGVYSATSEESAKVFNGAESYEQWQFTVDLLKLPVVVPADGRVTRARSDWIGRPFRDGLQPLTQQAPGARSGQRPGASGQELAPSSAPSRRGARDRRRER